MISDLSLQNMKGSSRSYRFTKANMVMGRNFSGKTTIEQAIRALVLGYVPGIKPETTAALKQFASAYPMSLEASIAGAQRRIAFDRAKSSVKQVDDRTVAADGIVEPTRVLFDPSIFFGLTDPGRISKACQLVQSTGGNPESLFKTVGAIFDNSTWSQRTLQSWSATVSGAKTINDLLDESETYWKNQKSEQNAEKARLQKMAEGLSDMNSVEAEIARHPSRHEIEGRKAELKAATQSLTEQIAAAKATAHSTELRRNRISHLASVVSSNADLPQKVAMLARELALDEAEVTRLNQESYEASAKWSSASQRAQLSDTQEKRRKQLGALVSALPSRRQKLDIGRASLANTRAEIERTTAALKKATEERNALRDQAPQPAEESPQDDAFTPGRRYQFSGIIEVTADENYVRVIEKRTAVPITEQTPEQEEEAMQQEFAHAQLLAEAEESVTVLSEQLANLRNRLPHESSLAELAHVELNNALRAEEELEAMNAAGAVPAPTAEELAALHSASQTAAAAAATANRTLDQKRKALEQARMADRDRENANDELSRLQAESYADAASPEQITAWEAERTAKQSSLKEADATIEAITRLEQDRKRIQDAAKVRDEAAGRAKLAGSALELIMQRKQEVVSGSIEKPLAIANKLAAGILKGPLVFEEGEVGMRVGDQFVSSRVFSGTESAIVMMGLTAGLAHRSSLRVLILDELGRLDTPNAVQLVINLCRMVAEGDIDQFIVIGPDNPGLLNLLGELELNVIHVD